MEKVRKRLINFRVTDEEFQYLKITSAHRHARSLSEFARAVILDAARADESPTDASETIMERLRAFERRLDRLESCISRIYGALVAESKLEDPQHPHAK